MKQPCVCIVSRLVSQAARQLPHNKHHNLLSVALALIHGLSQICQPLWALNSPVERYAGLLPAQNRIFVDELDKPLALQDAVGSAGPLLAILGFVLLPVVWSVPEALITAELATAFPENSGYVA